ARGLEISWEAIAECRHSCADTCVVVVEVQEFAELPARREQIADRERCTPRRVVGRDRRDDAFEVIGPPDLGRAPNVFDPKVGRDLVDTPWPRRVLRIRHPHRRTACSTITGSPRRCNAPTGTQMSAATGWS